jgi:hypothetical protein
MAAGTLDPRRLVIAVVITATALPALWLSQRSDSIGVSANGSVEVIILGEPTTTLAVRDRPPTPSLLGQPGGAFLIPPEPVSPDAVMTTTTTTTTIVKIPSPDRVAALPNPDDLDLDTFQPVEEILGSATFRSWLTEEDICAARAIPPDSIIRIINLDNGQATVCRVAFVSLGTHDVILSRTAFSRIADLTDAPIPVEISW